MFSFLSNILTSPLASRSVVNLLYLKFSAVIMILSFVVTVPPLIPLIKLPSSLTCTSVTLKINSSAKDTEATIK